MKSELDSIDDEVLGILSEKYNIPKYALKEMMHHPFKLLRRFQRNGEFYTIHLKGFGKFLVSDKAKNYNKRKKEIEEIADKARRNNILKINYEH